MRIGFSGNSNQNSGDNMGNEPPPDVYEAVIACIEDVGQHDDRNTPGAARRKVIAGFEIDWRDPKGRKPALFRKFNMNLWASADGAKKSDFRSFLDGVMPNAVQEAFDEKRDVETGDWVGKTVRVTVEHDARGRAVIRGFLRSKVTKAPDLERDWTQPFGLWKWLLDNRKDRD